MIILYKSWEEIKTIANTNNLQIQYVENNDLYKVYIVYENNTYTTELWINTDKIQGIDITQNNIDKQEFENNYKDNSKGVFTSASGIDIGAKTIETIISTKKNYKCQTINIEPTEQEYDLGAIYTEFTIMVTGTEDVIVKLNDIDNDEIPLKGGQNLRDVIGSDTFELSKIYHKTTGSGKISTILLWATKR